MSFLRHVGRVGDRKVAIVFREIPGEPHMCLVVYTEVIHTHLHDSIMKLIESDIGQHSDSLSEALNRTPGKDGRYLLQVLHQEGFLKKIQTEQVIVTPNGKTSIRLDELNKILGEMEQGEAAVKRMAEMDASRGLQDPADVARRLRGETPSVDRTASKPLQASGDGALDDASIAASLRDQAASMEAQAKSLMAESARLLSEAQALAPAKAAKTAKPKAAKKTSAKATA